MFRKDDSHDLASNAESAVVARGSHLGWAHGAAHLGTAYDARDMLPDADAQGGKGIVDYIDVFYRGFWVIIIVWLLIFAIVAAYTYSLTPVYRSSATLEVERINWRPRQSLAAPEHVDFSAYFATQIQILKSRGLAEDFLTSSNLFDSHGVLLSDNEGLRRVHAWVRSIYEKYASAEPHVAERESQAERKNRLINAFVKGISVKPLTGTDLAEVGFEANDPVMAQKLLTEYLDLYLVRNLEKRRNEHVKASEWLKGELAKVQSKLMDSEGKLLEFITENGIVSREGGFGEVMQLVNRSVERVRQSQEARIRIEAAQNQGDPDVAGSSIHTSGVGNQQLASLKQQLTQLETEYSELGGIYSPSSPKMTVLSKKMSFLKSKIEEVENSALHSALDQAKSEEKFLQDTLDGAKKEAARINALEARLALLKKDVEADRQFYNMILKEYKEMDIKAGTLFNNVSVVDAPRKPADPVRPRTIFNLLIGALLGLGGGLIAAIVVDSMDNTIRSPRDIDAELRVRRLGIIPDLTRQPVARGETVISGTDYEFLAHDEPRSSMSDAIRNIQTSIFLSHPKDRIRSMIISSATPSEGKTLISVSMASILSSGSNKKTLLVDADLRKPRIHKIFGRNTTGAGLSTLLTVDNVKLKDVIHAHRIPRFFYMTSGPVPVDPVSLLKSERMEFLMEYLGKIFDYIVFDSPPLLGFSDAQILSRYTDGMIMVAKQGHVGREELREAINSVFAIQGGKVLGVVLNKTRPRGSRYGYSGYYYYYSRNYKYYSKAAGDA
jgi:polysaccharide biosynthesis transport protein